MIPTRSRRSRARIARASSPAWAGVRTGERLTPTYARPPSTRQLASTSMHTRTRPSAPARSIISRCSTQSTITATRGSPSPVPTAPARASAPSALSSAVGYATTMSSKPFSASHSASGRVNASVPRKPSRASTRSCNARQRSDLLARRIGLPPARATRSFALSRNASRSTIANGASSSAVARSRRSYAASRIDGPEHAVGVRVCEATFRVQARAHREEALPVGVAPAQRRRRLEVALAPVRAPVELVHDRLDRVEVRLPLHSLEHVHRDERALASGRRADERVVRRDRTDLDREGDVKAARDDRAHHAHDRLGRAL